MNRLVESVKKLKDSTLKSLVNKRINEFKEIGSSSSDRIFIELCFCILTANYNAEKTIKIQEKIGLGFLFLPESKLVEELKKLGYRYPNLRAKYIIEARKKKELLVEALKKVRDENRLRELLVKNFRGLGYKEASHFLRNIGYTNVAIIDFHIVNILARYGLIKKFKVLTKRKYLEVEGKLRKTAEKLNLSLAELDLYLWYMETGKILK